LEELSEMAQSVDVTIINGTATPPGA